MKLMRNEIAFHIDAQDFRPFPRGFDRFSKNQQGLFVLALALRRGGREKRGHAFFRHVLLPAAHRFQRRFACLAAVPAVRVNINESRKNPQLLIIVIRLLFPIRQNRLNETVGNFQLSGLKTIINPDVSALNDHIVPPLFSLASVYHLFQACPLNPKKDTAEPCFSPQTIIEKGFVFRLGNRRRRGRIEFVFPSLF